MSYRAMLDECFAGKRLYGDDFSQAQVEEWFEQEREAYADLGAGDRSTYVYAYHALNREHGFRHLRKERFEHALGLGSAYGEEFRPIARKLARITIVEPSEQFELDTVEGVDVQRVLPSASGTLPFDDETFDLVLCFGVLHHIPNVSYVLSEIGRTLRPDGQVLLREPIVSMGDWRRPRTGLSPNERGIPLDLLREIVSDAGLGIMHERICMFAPMARLAARLGFDTYSSPRYVKLDAFASGVFRCNYRYHRTNVLHKFGPSAAFLVLERNDGLAGADDDRAASDESTNRQAGESEPRRAEYEETES